MRYSFFQPHGATSSKPELPSILHNIRAKNSSFGKPIKKRKKIAKIYFETINNDKLRLPFTYKKSVHTFNQFTIVTN